MNLLRITTLLAVFFSTLLFTACTREDLPPVIKLQGYPKDTIAYGSFLTYEPIDAMAFDDVDHDISSDVTMESDIDFFNVGWYKNTYSATDSKGQTTTLAQEVWVSYLPNIIENYYYSTYCSNCTGMFANYENAMFRKGRLGYDEVIFYYPFVSTAFNLHPITSVGFHMSDDSMWVSNVTFGSPTVPFPVSGYGLISSTADTIQIYLTVQPSGEPETTLNFFLRHF